MALAYRSNKHYTMEFLMGAKGWYAHDGYYNAHAKKLAQPGWTGEGRKKANKDNIVALLYTRVENEEDKRIIGATCKERGRERIKKKRKEGEGIRKLEKRGMKSCRIMMI